MPHNPRTADVPSPLLAISLSAMGWEASPRSAGPEQERHVALISVSNYATHDDAAKEEDTNPLTTPPFSLLFLLCFPFFLDVCNLPSNHRSHTHTYALAHRDLGSSPSLDRL